MDVRTYPFRRNGNRACAHASARRSSVNAALAGLVEGHLTASRPVCSRQYFMYSPWAVLPLVMIWRMDAVLRILFKSMGTTLRIRETSKNQYPGVPVIDRLQGMDDPGITGKQACFKTVFFM